MTALAIYKASHLQLYNELREARELIGDVYNSKVLKRGDYVIHKHPGNTLAIHQVVSASDTCYHLYINETKPKLRVWPEGEELTRGGRRCINDTCHPFKYYLKKSVFDRIMSNTDQSTLRLDGDRATAFHLMEGHRLLKKVITPEPETLPEVPEGW